MLESLDLALQFSKISSYRRSQNFNRLYYSVRVNQETAANIYPRFLIIYIIQHSNFPSPVTEHGIRNTAIDYFAEFTFIPGLVGKGAVNAYRQYLNP
jgi:hypothetical protein